MRIYLFSLSFILTLYINTTNASMVEEQVIRVASPTLGPVLGLQPENKLRFWWRGPVIAKDNNASYYGVLSLKRVGDQNPLVKSILMETYFDQDDSKPIQDLISYTDIALDPGEYEYSCGYYPANAHGQTAALLSWENIESYRFKFQPENHNVAVGFGSCRYFIKLSCLHLFLTSSDHIFEGMNQAQLADKRIDSFFALGDFIYADSLRCLNSAHSYNDFKRLYELAMSTPHFRQTLATIPFSLMGDDHEIRNNFDQAFIDTQPEVYRAAIQAYGTYQYMMNPPFQKELALPFGGYEISVRGIPAFVLDTRFQRTESPSRIISDAAMHQFICWMSSKVAQVYKLVFTPVTLAPAFASNQADNADIWYGHLDQLLQILGHIDNNQISGMIFCAGDRHTSDYVQFTTPKTKTIVTSITSSPLYWPLGLGSYGRHDLQTEAGITEFVPGYSYVLHSQVYTGNNYGRIEFLGDNELLVEFLDANGNCLNKDDPVGTVLNLKYANESLDKERFTLLSSEDE